VRCDRAGDWTVESVYGMSVDFRQVPHSTFFSLSGQKVFHTRFRHKQFRTLSENSWVHRNSSHWNSIDTASRIAGCPTHNFILFKRFRTLLHFFGNMPG
jgi:hypothetical protein